MAFRTIKAIHVADGITYIESSCNSNDTKPTEGIANGSLCHETDTKKILAFDETESDWVEQCVLSE